MPSPASITRATGSQGRPASSPSVVAAIVSSVTGEEAGIRAELPELEALVVSGVDACAAPSDGSTPVPDTGSGVPLVGASAVAIEDTSEPREDGWVDTGPSAGAAIDRSERGPSGRMSPAPAPAVLAAEAAVAAAVVALPDGGGSPAGCPAAGCCPAAGGSWLVGAPPAGSGTFPAVEV